MALTLWKIDLVLRQSHSVSVWHQQERKWSIYGFFFQPVFTGAGPGRKVCKKAPRGVGWLISFSLPSFDIYAAREERAEMVNYLKRTRAEFACFMHWGTCPSPLIGLYGSALIRHEYVIIYIFNLPLVNFNFSKVKHWTTSHGLPASHLDHWGQRGSSHSPYTAGLVKYADWRPPQK